MKRRGLALVLAVFLGTPAAASSQAPAANLQGTFAMGGVVTKAVHVLGEYRGESVTRSWTFTPGCASGDCEQVVLQRQRSSGLVLDQLVLDATGSNTYAGQGQFWVPVRCAGHVIAQGGIANEEIEVQITQTTTIGSTVFATAITATYTNPSRVNLTGCPGGIGRDAASYTGALASSLP